MELLYQVDELDNVIGPVDRQDAHRSGLLHRSGMIFVRRRDGKVLIQHRSRSKETFPGCLDSSAAFHVTYGESYESAASRELLEETGISAPMTYVGKFIHRDPPENEVVAVYHCDSDEAVRVDPAESEGFEFLALADVDALLASSRPTPWLRDGWPLARKILDKTYLGRR